MLIRVATALVLTVVSASAAPAQGNPSADTLIANWLRQGAFGNWQPHTLFTGCPALAGWQRRGIDLLLSAELSRQRADELALAWIPALRNCNSPRVEQWYFGQVDAAMRRGDAPEGLLNLWTALASADSPRIRDYLQTLMLNPGKPEPYRTHAGWALFERFGPQERVDGFLEAFETRRMPFRTAVAVTSVLLRENPDGLLRVVGDRVRANPALADQTAFTMIAESSARYASAASRRALGQALNAGLRRSTLTGRQRTRLQNTAEWLERARGR
jgi:hypothetical protein